MKLNGRITWEEVRCACINHNWYTCGDSAAYLKLMENVNDRKNINLADGSNAWDTLTSFAKDIKQHSDTDYSVEDIANALLLKVDWYFDGDYMEND